MKVWVVVDVGCLECWEPTHVLGVYTSREAALESHPDAAEDPDAGRALILRESAVHFSPIGAAR